MQQVQASLEHNQVGECLRSRERGRSRFAKFKRGRSNRQETLEPAGTLELAER